jgi:hypothetical protein
MIVALTLECEVEVPSGLADLESQGQGRVPHPVVGWVICLSCRASLDGAVPYQSSLSSDVVLSTQGHAGMASDLEMSVLSVLAE